MKTILNFIIEAIGVTALFLWRTWRKITGKSDSSDW